MVAGESALLLGSGSPPSPGEDHPQSLAGFHLLQAKPVYPSIFPTLQFLCILVMGVIVKLVRLPPVPRAESVQGWPSSLQTEPWAGPDFVTQGLDSYTFHKTVSILDNPTSDF